MGKNEGKINWLVWNTANIITSLRFFIPFVFFYPEIFFWVDKLSLEQKIFWGLILASGDLFDGKIARMAGNTNGAGKWLDPLADKISSLSFAYFFYRSEIIDSLLLHLVLATEIITVIIIAVKARIIWTEDGILSKRFINKEFWLKATEKKKRLREGLNVSLFGKFKMGSFFTGAVAAYLSIATGWIFLREIYLSLFWAGVGISFITMLTYLFNIRWSKVFS